MTEFGSQVYNSPTHLLSAHNAAWFLSPTPARRRSARAGQSWRLYSRHDSIATKRYSNEGPGATSSPDGGSHPKNVRAIEIKQYANMNNAPTNHQIFPTVPLDVATRHSNSTSHRTKQNKML